MARKIAVQDVPDHLQGAGVEIHQLFAGHFPAHVLKDLAVGCRVILVVKV